MRTFNAILGLTVLLFVCGCAELRNGDRPSDSASKPTFYFGELRYTEVTTYDRAWVALQVAMKELGYTIKSSEKDLLQTKMVAKAGDKEIKVELEENSPTTTEIRIRAGKLGDKALSQHVLETIRKHL